MESLLEKDIDGLNLDRSDWQLVKFGDVAIQQKQTVDRENTGLTRYVKGEHMCSEDLHLREWGELKDEYLGPAFIRKFEEGDILYGSRRTYLRKVVIAPFEGITSNTTFVIKANEKRIDRRLLPFVMMSEGFAQHSIRNSKGSVNPYVNWKDLSGYEFLLPSKEQQILLAKLFEANDKMVRANRSVVQALSVLTESKSKYLLGLSKESPLQRGWRTLMVKDISPLQRGFDLPNDELKNGKYPVGYSNGIKNYHSSFQVEGPGVWTGRSGTIGNVFYTESNYWPHNTTLWVTDFKGNHPRYVYHLYSNMHFERKLAGTGVPTLNRNDIHKLKVSIPHIEEQINISEEIDLFVIKLRQAKKALERSKELQKSLLNQVF